MARKYCWAAVFLGVILLALHRYLTREDQYLTSLSPNMSYRLELFRHRIIPYIQGVRVVARVTNLGSGTKSENEIADLDEWYEAPLLFNEVEWNDSVVTIRPGKDKPAVVQLP